LHLVAPTWGGTTGYAAQTNARVRVSATTEGIRVNAPTDEASDVDTAEQGGPVEPGALVAARFTVRAFTDVGLRRRRNEDAVMVGGWTCQTHDGTVVTMDFAPAPPFVCAVADGMGGHAGGDLASRTALSVLAASYREWRAAEDVFDDLLSVNQQVRAIGDEHDVQGLGTTVAGLCFLADELVVFNVGDSRIYSLTDGDDGAGPQQLSVDDSVFDTNGRPTNVITQSMGQPIPVRPHLLRLPLTPGRFLLCSDGVSGMLTDDELRDVLGGSDVDAWCDAIIATVRANGADDNFSFLIVEVSAG
jgi:PPM family protein phosphatase